MNKNIDYGFKLEELNKNLSIVLGTVEELKANLMPKNNDEWLDSKGAARYMGVSLRTIMTYKEKGLIRCSKVMGKLYFKKSELQSIIEKSEI